MESSFATAGRAVIERRIALLAAFILPLVGAGPANAQIFRCERDGKVAYSDRPCETGATSTPMAQQPAGSNGTLGLRVTQSHYDVRGQDYPSLAQSLRDNGPRGFHGLARWKVGYDYTTTNESGGCRIAKAAVTVSGDILMPRWLDEASAPFALQQRWREYYAALLRHEEGHIQHGREFALLVKERLLGLGTVPCDRLPALAQAEFDRLYGNLKDRDREYDKRTNHGATQGARF